MAQWHFYIAIHLSENVSFASWNCTCKLSNGNYCNSHLQIRAKPISIAKLSRHSLVDAGFQMFAMQASRGTCYLLAIASAVDKRNNWDLPLRQSSENKVCWELAAAASWVAQFLVGVCGGINSGLSALTGWLLNAYLIEAQGTLASEAGLVRTKRESSLLRWMMMMVHSSLMMFLEFHMYSYDGWKRYPY